MVKKCSKWIILSMLLSSSALFILNMIEFTHLSVWMLLAPIWLPLIPWIFTVILLWIYGRKGN